jgi:hypothetical protein
MIVVSIGAAVMVVIQGLSEENLQSIESQKRILRCGTDVSAEILTVGSKYRMCINHTAGNNGTVAYFIENTGIRDINGWRITAIGDAGVFSANYDSTTYLLNKGDIRGYRFNYTDVGTGTTEVDKIQIFPRIEGAPGNEIVSCQEPNLEFDEDFIDNLDACADVTWEDGLTAMS